MMTRKRADVLLVERGLFDSRTRAQAAIAAGRVTADGVVLRKASDEIAVGAQLEATPEHPWVSRGALKLVAALDHFGFDPVGRVCLDVGASTGGFTEVLLARGARRVYAVDVGRGQLHARLAGNPAVVSREATDIRALDPAVFAELPDFVSVDVSFISLKLVLPALDRLLRRPAQLVALIKPQFEAGRKHLKKGILHDAGVQAAVCDDIAAFTAAHGWSVVGVIPSPIEGGEGNREFLLGARRPA
jgi:23S rRNA (cytidine1920-2'-O)/16S rRNA (cytidine1409-2'-O)-methyltransferase